MLLVLKVKVLNMKIVKEFVLVLMSLNFVMYIIKSNLMHVKNVWMVISFTVNFLEINVLKLLLLLVIVCSIMDQKNVLCVMMDFYWPMIKKVVLKKLLVIIVCLEVKCNLIVCNVKKDLFWMKKMSVFNRLIVRFLKVV